MAQMIQKTYDNSIQVPIETAQAVQKNRETTISLEALGLLVNLASYPTKWELNKTELYKRFAKHGERSVRAAWNSLMDANYIIEFKYRVGKKYEYVYYFRKFPFSEEERAEILEEAAKEYGEIWGLQNEDPKMKTSKRRGNQKTLLNKNNILNKNNKENTEAFDDDKRTDSSPIHNEDEINMIISALREETKDDLRPSSFKNVVSKVRDKYKQGKVKNFRDYLVTALINKIEELEVRRAKAKNKEELQQNKKEFMEKRRQRLANTEINPAIPFYNWLEEEK
ncbi:hypothetical protein ABEX78_32385 [Priestia megaterium]